MRLSSFSMDLTSWPAYAAFITFVPTPWTCAAEEAALSARRSYKKMISPKHVFSCISSVMWLAAWPKECSCQGKGQAGPDTTARLFSASVTGLSHLSNYSTRLPGTPLLSDFPEKHAVCKWCRGIELHLVTTDSIALYFPSLLLTASCLLL